MKYIQIIKKNTKIICCILLIYSILITYWKIQQNEFINLDDESYITLNKWVKYGITSKGIKWAFDIHNQQLYWHPLTYLSHMIDCQTYGLNPGGHHLNNLIIHLLNTLILYLTLKRMTGTFWRSIIVTAIFALHPINVESIAWAAERKNVLSSLFWMLTLYSYSFYIEKPNLKRYAWVFICQTLGLLAKPMLVTLPFLLLLLDIWPLKRLDSPSLLSKKNILYEEINKQKWKIKKISYLIIEKTPLIISSIIFISLYVLSKGSSIIQITRIVPFKLRVQNALVSYVVYIYKLIWPSKLTLYYPFPESIPFYEYLGAGLLILFITVFTISKIKKYPYLLIGWLWFIGTLFPVIGLVQQGLWPAYADRFVYMPMIGILIMIVWGMNSIIEKIKINKFIIISSIITIISTLMILTNIQMKYWKNSITLFEHAIIVTKKNHLAHRCLGLALFRKGQFEKAMIQFQESLDSGYPMLQYIYNDMGNIFYAEKKYEQAYTHFELAIKNEPGYAFPYIKLGSIMFYFRNKEKGEAFLKKAFELAPNDERLLNNIGVVLYNHDMIGRSISYFQKALEIDPNYIVALNNLRSAKNNRNI